MAKNTKTVVTSNLATIKDAIIQARSEGNKGAISEKMCTELNISKQALDQWSAWCEQLREDCVAYLSLCDKQEGDDKAIARALSHVWESWKKLLKVGTEQEFDKNFFLRKSDVNRICHMCAERIYRSTKFNAQLVYTTDVEFRKNLETLIGIRLAGNGILSNEDRDTMITYESAQRTIKSKTEALDGCKRGKIDVAGLRTILARKEHDLEEADTFIKAFELPEEAAKKYKKQFEEAIAELKKQIKAAEETLDKAKKTEEEYAGKYAILEQKLNVIGATL